MLKGWYQVAFESELTDDITALDLDKRKFIVVKDGNTFRTFDAHCPHRGVHLAAGGKIDRNYIVCPFHGLRIHMGADSSCQHKIREYQTVTVSGLVFVCLEEGPHTGFPDYLTQLASGHYIHPGFTMTVKVPFQMIVENAFDNMHFRTVHRIFNEPVFNIQRSENGAFSVTGSFGLPSSQYQKHIPAGQQELLPYYAVAFSPGIVISNLGGPSEYYVITTAIPLDAASAVLRLSIAVKREEGKPLPNIDDLNYLVIKSQKGLMADKHIWENMDLSMIPKFTAGDAAVIGYQNFCAPFLS